MERYKLGWLSEEFGRHGEELEKGSYYKEGDFSLPNALKTLVDEVEELTRQVMYLERELEEIRGDCGRD